MSWSLSSLLVESVHRLEAFWELTSHVVGGRLVRDSKDPWPSEHWEESHESSSCACFHSVIIGRYIEGGRLTLGYLPYLRSSLILQQGCLDCENQGSFILKKKKNLPHLFILFTCALKILKEQVM